MTKEWHREKNGHKTFKAQVRVLNANTHMCHVLAWKYYFKKCFNSVFELKSVV